MAAIGSDGLSLLVGDGNVSETFNALRGAVVSRVEISQQLNDSTAVASDAWVSGVGVTERRLVLECDVVATDEAATVRLRSLALAGNAGNMQLEVKAAEVMQFAAFVTQYREVIQAGEMKRVVCRLESSGAVALV